jgi:hypothetical protein
MSFSSNFIAAILALSSAGGAVPNPAQPVWFERDGPPLDCRLMLDDSVPAWLCLDAVMQRRTHPAIQRTGFPSARLPSPGKALGPPAVQ